MFLYKNLSPQTFYKQFLIGNFIKDVPKSVIQLLLIGDSYIDLYIADLRLKKSDFVLISHNNLKISIFTACKIDYKDQDLVLLSIKIDENLLKSYQIIMKFNEKTEKFDKFITNSLQNSNNNGQPLQNLGTRIYSNGKILILSGFLNTIAICRVDLDLKQIIFEGELNLQGVLVDVLFDKKGEFCWILSNNPQNHNKLDYFLSKVRVKAPVKIENESKFSNCQTEIGLQILERDLNRMLILNKKSIFQEKIKNLSKNSKNSPNCFELLNNNDEYPIKASIISKNLLILYVNGVLIRYNLEENGFIKSTSLYSPLLIPNIIQGEFIDFLDRNILVILAEKGLQLIYLFEQSIEIKAEIQLNSGIIDTFLKKEGEIDFYSLAAKQNSNYQEFIINKFQFGKKIIKIKSFELKITCKNIWNFKILDKNYVFICDEYYLMGFIYGNNLQEEFNHSFDELIIEVFNYQNEIICVVTKKKAYFFDFLNKYSLINTINFEFDEILLVSVLANKSYFIILNENNEIFSVSTLKFEAKLLIALKKEISTMNLSKKNNIIISEFLSGSIYEYIYNEKLEFKLKIDPVLQCEIVDFYVFSCFSSLIYIVNPNDYEIVKKLSIENPCINLSIYYENYLILDNKYLLSLNKEILFEKIFFDGEIPIKLNTGPKNSLIGINKNQLIFYEMNEKSDYITNFLKSMIIQPKNSPFLSNFYRIVLFENNFILITDTFDLYIFTFEGTLLCSSQVFNESGIITLFKQGEKGNFFIGARVCDEDMESADEIYHHYFIILKIDRNYSGNYNSEIICKQEINDRIIDCKFFKDNYIIIASENNILIYKYKKENNNMVSLERLFITKNDIKPVQIELMNNELLAVGDSRQGILLFKISLERKVELLLIQVQEEKRSISCFIIYGFQEFQWIILAVDRLGNMFVLKIGENIENVNFFASIDLGITTKNLIKSGENVFYIDFLGGLNVLYNWNGYYLFENEEINDQLMNFHDFLLRNKGFKKFDEEELLLIHYDNPNGFIDFEIFEEFFNEDRKDQEKLINLFCSKKKTNLQLEDVLKAIKNMKINH